VHISVVIQELVACAEKAGFHLSEPLNLESKERPEHWLGLDYTFIYFTLAKV
jgi:hypothetical protein